MQTRRQYQDWVNNRGADYTTDQSQECEECSQASNNSNHSFSNSDYDTSHVPSGATYRANDVCKRHRNRDGEPYSEVVTSYRRRKPA